MKKNSYFNSTEHLEELTKRQLNESSDHPVLEDLEGQYEALQKVQGMNLRDELISSSDTVSELFCFMVDMGLYPPPEVLLALLDCFNLHTASEGKIPLDQVFYDKGVSAAGNKVMEKGRDMRMLKFSFGYENHCRKSKTRGDKKPSLEAFAEEYLAKNPQVYDVEINDSGEIVGRVNREQPDASSFIRKYRRWKKDQADN